MNTALLDRLRSFQIPPSAPLSSEHYLVARLMGIDFEGILESPDFGFTEPFDADFGKMMVRTASHLLGGDACGRYAFTELMEMSLLLDRGAVAAQWSDASDLSGYLVALSSAKMSLQVEDEALFGCKLYAFSTSDLVVSYLMWRQQEADLSALNRYCRHVLSTDDSDPESVVKIMEGLGPLEKEEILRQHDIEYDDLPAWQRTGTAVYLASDGNRVIVDTNLPQDDAYRPYILQYLE